jgi:hypothetical protein
LVPSMVVWDPRGFILHNIGNFPRPTRFRYSHMAFSLQKLYDYVPQLCRKQAEVIQTHGNANVHNIGRGEARYRKHKRLKLGGGGGQANDGSSD